MKFGLINFARRQYLVDKKVQLVFVVFGLINSFLAVFIGMSLQYLSSLDCSMTSEEMSVRTKFSVFIIVITFFVISYGLGLVLSNRIAGPIFRLQNETKKMLDSGEFKPISVRKDDYFKDFVETYNQLIKRLTASGK